VAGDDIEAWVLVGEPLGGSRSREDDVAREGVLARTVKIEFGDRQRPMTAENERRRSRRVRNRANAANPLDAMCRRGSSPEIRTGVPRERSIERTNKLAERLRSAVRQLTTTRESKAVQFQGDGG
jgi:hypothetical protein